MIDFVPIIYSRPKLTKMAEKKEFRGKNVEDHFYFLLNVMAYLTCIICFVMNSYAVFQGFLSNPTIISTKVIKSPKGTLEFPSILICNETAFKVPVMVTDYYGYKNNTLSLDDFLVDIKMARNVKESILNTKLVSLKGAIKEISTMFHGTCFLYQEKLQVGTISILSDGLYH